MTSKRKHISMTSANKHTYLLHTNGGRRKSEVKVKRNKPIRIILEQ